MEDADLHSDTEIVVQRVGAPWPVVLLTAFGALWTGVNLGSYLSLAEQREREVLPSVTIGGDLTIGCSGGGTQSGVVYDSTATPRMIQRQALRVPTPRAVWSPIAFASPRTTSPFRLGYGLRVGDYTGSWCATGDRPWEPC